MPSTSNSVRSTSPVCKPARTLMPRGAVASVIALAQWIARAGPSNKIRNPSPNDLTSLPRKRATSLRTVASCASSSSRHALSPTFRGRAHYIYRRIVLRGPMLGRNGTNEHHAPSPTSRRYPQNMVLWRRKINLFNHGFSTCSLGLDRILRWWGNPNITCRS